MKWVCSEVWALYFWWFCRFFYVAFLRSPNVLFGDSTWKIAFDEDNSNKFLLTKVPKCALLVAESTEIWVFGAFRPSKIDRWNIDIGGTKNRWVSSVCDQSAILFFFCSLDVWFSLMTLKHSNKGGYTHWRVTLAIKVKFCLVWVSMFRTASKRDSLDKRHSDHFRREIFSTPSQYVANSLQTAPEVYENWYNDGIVYAMVSWLGYKSTVE